MMTFKAAKPNLIICLIQEDYAAGKMGEAAAVLHGDPTGYECPDPRSFPL
jgi:hypothetical protein